MANFNEKLNRRRKQYEEDVDSLIATLTLLRKRLGTRTEYDKRRHRYFDEAVNKLRELQYLIGLIINLDIRSINVTTLMAMELQFTDRKHWPRDHEIKDLLIKMSELAEAFYYAAYRVCRTLEKLTIICKAKGVEDVKNFLSSHPEIMSRSIGSSMDDRGPRLKSELIERHNTNKRDQFRDKGLYANFDEFIAHLKKALGANQGF